MEFTKMKKLAVAHISIFARKCAVDLDIQGHIQAYGRPMPLNELARSIPIPPEKDSMLRRLMTLLVHQGIFMQSEQGYLLTPVSELLLIEGCNTGAFVPSNTTLEVRQRWARFSEMFTDTGTSTLFQKLFDGKKFWEIMKERPNLGHIFNEKMASLTQPFMRGLVATYPHIFEGLHSLVDVGGGTGTAVEIIAEAFPGLRCTLFDLPHVVEGLKNDSFHVVGGDMFEKIPSADAIFLKNILHDWNDEDCIQILKRCKEAIIECSKNNGGKVIVVDIIIDLESDDREAVETSLLYDIAMMGCNGSKERNKQEWHDIILRAGYSAGYKISSPRLGVDSVIELYP